MAFYWAEPSRRYHKICEQRSERGMAYIAAAIPHREIELDFKHAVTNPAGMAAWSGIWM